MYIGQKGHDYLQQEYMLKIIDLITETIGSRYSLCPLDYPPSEWRQYTKDTEKLWELMKGIESICIDNRYYYSKRIKKYEGINTNN